MIKRSLKILKARINGLIKRHRHLRACVGERSYVDPSVQVLGWSHVWIGADCTVGENTILNVNNRTNGTDKRIEINDNSYIGRNNFFSSGKLIRLKNYCLTANNCSFVGSDHIYDDPEVPYALSGTTENGVIEVGANCWFGYGVTVVGSVKIGHGCIIGAGTLINKDVPPFSVVVGNPQRIVRQYDFQKRKWEKYAGTENSARAAPDETTYLELLKTKHPSLPIAYRSASGLFGDL